MKINTILLLLVLALLGFIMFGKYAPKLGYSSTPSVNVFSGGVVHSDVRVDSSPTLILSRNMDRKYASISNNGTSTVYIWFNTSTDLVAGNKGIRLNSAGGILEIDTDNLYLGNVYGITSSTDGDTRISALEK